MNRKFVYYLIRLILWFIASLGALQPLRKYWGFNYDTLIWTIIFLYGTYQVYYSEQKIKSTFN